MLRCRGGGGQVLHRSGVRGRRCGRAVVRLVRRAHGPLRLHRHLRAGPPDRRRATASAATSLELVRELGVTIVRYPGGNFVSGYDWEDGVGPRERAARAGSTSPGTRSRPTRSASTSSSRWARKAGVEPMMAVNLGTRGVEEARRPASSTATTRPAPRCSDLRARQRRTPSRTASGCGASATRWTARGRSATRPPTSTAGSPPRPRKAMRLRRPVDRARRLRQLATRGCRRSATWEATVLEHAYDVVDYISLHAYYEPRRRRPRRASSPRARRHGPLHRRRSSPPPTTSPRASAADKQIDICLRRVERLVPAALARARRALDAGRSRAPR